MWHRLAKRHARHLSYILLSSGLSLVNAPPVLAEDQRAKLALGKQIFRTDAKPQCGICHTLADAGTSGTIGPNLDKLKRTEEQIRKAVRSGIGVMPRYENLSEEEVSAVAHYVATIAGQTE